jgi:uncharacterized protein YjbI with pentapeptide repeats
MPCGYQYENEHGDLRTCPRDTYEDADWCPFHYRTAAETPAADVPTEALRRAFCADVASGDERRTEYVDVTVGNLDLSGLAAETDALEPLTFRNATVEGTVDVSKSAFDQPVRFQGCEFGSLDAMDASFDRSLTIEDCAFGGSPGTCFTARRASVAGALDLSNTELDGSVEFAGCSVGEWLNVDGVTVTGGAHFQNASLARVQVIDTAFGRSAQFSGVDAAYATFESVSFSRDPRFDDARFEELRVHPAGSAEVRLHSAVVRDGRLDQPPSGDAYYDLTGATLGDVAIDCGADTLDHFRFYRTEYDGFSFADYREFFRRNDWLLHVYAGEAEDGVTLDGLERTYLEAKQGASDVGDHENASAFFVRELRYRRRRYGEHAADSSRSVGHRFDASLRWLTNAFLDVVAGYGERPQRTVVAAVTAILASALLYPALGGLVVGDRLVTYGTAGLSALPDSLYFSVATFTTLGLGDVQPAGGLSKLVAASEAISGAFLAALLVFALGRRVSR